MSTILKALRRLEEDSAQKQPSTPLGSDAELRDRILAEESAAATLDPASSRADSRSLSTSGSASDSTSSAARRGSRPLSTFFASLSLRSLTPIALGLVLLLSVGSAIWYWNGGASSLDPTKASPPDPAALAVAPAPRAAVPPRVLPTAPERPAQPIATPRAARPSATPAADAAQDRRIAAAPVAVPVVPLNVADSAGAAGTPADRAISRSTATGGNAAAPSRSASTSASAARPAPAVDPIETPSAARVAAVSAPVVPARPTPPASGASRPAAGRAPVSAAAPSPRPSPSRPAPEVERLDHRGLPDLTVLRTAWHPTPERRTAKVRLEASKEVLNLHEGDAVGGLVVQEISPSSILFQSGDVEIRRRVGQGSTR